MTAFVVERGDEGVSFGEPMKKLGQRAILSTEVFLHDVDLPADRLLGEEGKGFYSLMHTFDESRDPPRRRRGRDRAGGARLQRRVRGQRETRSESRSAATRRSGSGWPTWRPGSTRRGCSPIARPG